jgi:hypothetical protein
MAALLADADAALRAPSGASAPRAAGPDGSEPARPVDRLEHMPLGNGTGRH